MAEFTGERTTTVRINRPLADVFAAFIDTDVRASCMLDLKRKERVDDDTMRWVMKEENQKGIRFTPDYTVKYDDNGEDTFSWKTISGNPRSTGKGVCKAVSDSTTEVVYEERINIDIPVPRLLAAVIKGMVGKQIASGVDRFLDDMKSSIERG